MREATRRDVRPLSRMLARAFHDDPVHRWMFPDEAARRRWAPRQFAVLLKRRVRDGHVGTSDDLASAAVWVPPGSPAMGTWETLAATAVFVAGLGRRALRVGRGFQELQALHPPAPCWYLLALGTDPDARGRGLGASLLRPALERCDLQAVCAYLESSKEQNVPYYERFGFVVTGEYRLPGGPPLWLMLRKPRSR